MSLSIIIPALNEEDRIGPQVSRCLALFPRPEVIVADGGSGDGTVSRAAAAGARIVASPLRGRASQMNAGAGASSGDTLLFLHADVTLEQPAWGAMLEALGDPLLCGGAFRRRFDSPSRLLRLGCRLADLRGRWLRLFLGDQAIFVRRSTFTALGGFPEIPLFEDLDLSRRLARHGKTVLVRGTVVASSRRFERAGPLAQLLRNLLLTGLYFAGIDPARLARHYDAGNDAVPRGGPGPAALAAPGSAFGSRRPAGGPR